MRLPAFPSRRTGALVVLVTVLASVPAEGRQAPPIRGGVVVDAQDARQVRSELEQLLRRLPPSVGAVLRLDPSLLRSESYLATYPALAAFLQAHPEVVNNAEYYLQNVNVTSAFPGVRLPQPAVTDPRTEAIRMWRQMWEGLTILAVFAVVTGGLVWLIGSLINLRRWSRTSRVQAEVHGKLLDRFTSNEDLLAYIQTPAGRRFLESAPLAAETRTPQVSAPLSRMLWSMQAGVVLAVAAIGLLFISRRVIEEVAQVVFAAGVLVLAVGVGFIVSVGASYVLSRRLGLFERPGARGSDPAEA